MKKLPSHVSLAGAAMLAALSTLIACGDLSDPTKPAGERIATVSGALTGTDVPAGARVALVWRASGAGAALAVGSDAAIVGGKFTMALSEPPSSYFRAVEGGELGSGSSSGAGESSSGEGGGEIVAPEPPASSSGGGGGSFAFSKNVAPRDSVDGQITGQLSAAVAGFVVYVDTNGNGQLDLDSATGTSTDEVIGGNRELALFYLKGGGELDYEKLRDRTSVAPKAGYNVGWQDRWLPLDVVELKIASATKLPSAVCGGSTLDLSSSSSSSSGAPAPRAPGSGSSGGLTCEPDGRGYCLTGCSWPTPTPPGLCSEGGEGDPMCGTECIALQSEDPVPADWPCPVVTDGGAPEPDGGGVLDGGAAPDAGH